MDYQLLVEADFLVNLFEEGALPETREDVFRRIFRTAKRKISVPADLFPEDRVREPQNERTCDRRKAVRGQGYRPGLKMRRSSINGAMRGRRLYRHLGPGPSGGLWQTRRTTIKKYKEWKMEDLPMMPETFKLEVIRQTGKAVSGRKGADSPEGRGRDHHRHRCRPGGRAGGPADSERRPAARKPLKRLWISSVTDKAIREGFANLKDGREYENLYDAAMCRAEADWLVGINATRALTCKYNAQLSCGRVQTPTLAMIASREEEIRTLCAKVLLRDPRPGRQPHPGLAGQKRAGSGRSFQTGTDARTGSRRSPGEHGRGGAR